LVSDLPALSFFLASASLSFLLGVDLAAVGCGLAVILGYVAGRGGEGREHAGQDALEPHLSLPMWLLALPEST
jgi:ABC-type dipeptide/oligopeptide/nickel transport system permease subunit